MNSTERRSLVACIRVTPFPFVHDLDVQENLFLRCLPHRMLKKDYSRALYQQLPFRLML